MARPEARLSPDGTRIAVKYPHDTAGAAYPWLDTSDRGRMSDADVELWMPLLPDPDEVTRRRIAELEERLEAARRG